MRVIGAEGGARARATRGALALLATFAALALLATFATLATFAAGACALTLSPLSGTPDASPSTQISFLGAHASDISHVSVVGSRSGSHGGRLRSYASAPGASYVPARPFAEGERVSASAVVRTGRHPGRVRTTFTIARLAHPALPPAKPRLPAKAGLNQSFVSEPSLQPPSVQVRINSPAATPGDILLTAGSGYGQAGAMIVDGAGRLVWFQPAAKGNEVDDLQAQSYAGRPVLTFWQGHVDLGVGFGEEQIYDSSYRRIASVAAGNGYYADLHEFQITPQGSAYVTAYSLVRADLSSAGGSRDGALQDGIVQQVDIATGLVMFEWHAYGRVPVEDSYAKSPFDANRPWDFFHINSISPDPWGDGDLLISSRNTWAVYEIDHHHGSVLWRIGGKKSSFRMGPGTGTAWQHDARWQPDHTLTIFDNGAVPRVHSQSRAIRERIDWKHRSVALVSRAVRTPAVLSGSQGNAQLMPGGNSFVGWGEAPYFTEFSPSGEILFDGHLPTPAQVYRAFRFPWSAIPARPPAIALRVTGPATTTLYASWNGATGVSGWRVLGGDTPATLATIATLPASGFETAMALPSAARVFAVQALGVRGEVLGSSHALQR